MSKYGNVHWAQEQISELLSQAQHGLKSHEKWYLEFWYHNQVYTFQQGIARTQTPTNKNYALELFTFETIVGVSLSVVQWTGLTLGEPPSWSWLTPAPGKYAPHMKKSDYICAIKALNLKVQKWSKNGPKTVLQQCNKCAKMVQKWSKNGPKTVKFGWNCDIWLILWYLADIVIFGWYCESRTILD